MNGISSISTRNHRLPVTQKKGSAPIFLGLPHDAAHLSYHMFVVSRHRVPTSVHLRTPRPWTKAQLYIARILSHDFFTPIMDVATLEAVRPPEPQQHTSPRTHVPGHCLLKCKPLSDSPHMQRFCPTSSSTAPLTVDPLSL